MRVEFSLGIGYANARHSEIVEYDEDVSDEQLDKDWAAWSQNYIDGGPERLED